MAGSITITGKESFEDQSGDLVFVDPDTTKRPVTHWSIPRWWNKNETVIYAGCARVDNTAAGESIYIASSTAFPRLKIEWDGTDYTFDSDHKREHINRIFVTSDPTFKVGDDYLVPIRDTATDFIHKVI